MEKNRLKVGLFVTVSFVLLMGVILWLAGSRFMRPVDAYRIVFDKSVSGLLPGAAVEYHGVTVGKVETLRLTSDVPPRAEVTIAVQPGTGIRTDTTAYLIGSFVTGIRYIELEGGTSGAARLQPGGNIGAREGGLEEFRDQASEIAQRLLETLTRIEQGLLSQDNLAFVTAFLQNTSQLAQDVRVSFQDLSTPETRRALTTMVDNLAQAAAGIKSATEAINTIRGDLYNDGKAMMVQIRQTAAITAKLAGEVRQVTQSIDDVLVENRYEVHQLLANLADTSRQLKALSETVRHNPSGLIWGTRPAARDVPDE